MQLTVTSDDDLVFSVDVSTAPHSFIVARVHVILINVSW